MKWLRRIWFCEILGWHNTGWNKVDSFRAGIRGYEPYCRNCGRLAR